MYITDRDLHRAAVVRAAGYEVRICRAPCSPRCMALYPDIFETRKIMDRFDKNHSFDISAKKILNCHGQLQNEARKLRKDRLEA